MKTTKPEVTARGSMSFYVTVSQTPTPVQRDLASKASQFGDALTLAGSGGPRMLRELRDSGFTDRSCSTRSGTAGGSLIR